MSEVSRNLFMMSVVDKTADGSNSFSDYIIGGWKSRSGAKRPSGIGIATSGLLAGATDDLYTRRRAEGRSAIRSALGYLNPAIGAVAGGVAGVPLAPLTFGASIPVGIATGATAQTALADSGSPFVHLIPTLGGIGAGALIGGTLGGLAGNKQFRAEDVGAGALIGAGVGGVGGYALSRLIN